MKRTQDEIVARIEARKSKDVFGFEVSEYVDFLDFEHARQYLKGDATAEQWAEAERPLTDVRQVMIDYMPFAWQKANNCRGISAGRSLAHYQAWLWLDGNDELAEQIRTYEYYGKPQLEEICTYLGLDSAQWDNGRRTNSDDT